MEGLREKLEIVVLKHLSKGSIFGFNQEAISPKKLENVKTVHEIIDEEILIIYDGTLFGSAKDGMVFTDKAIYWREMLGNSQKLDYREIVESTANKKSANKTIRILDKVEEVKTKDSYYDLICELRQELIESFIVYETYYQSALKSFEASLIRLSNNEQFGQVIEEINQYDGLFLREKDKSATIYEVLFKAYLMEKEFSRAGSELDILESKSPRFYKEAAPLLERAIKEDKYFVLETDRLKAIENKAFNEAYKILDQQKGLNIIERDNMAQIELEMKETHYGSLEIDRLKTLDEEEYKLAFSLLERQKELNIRPDFKIEQIKENMEENKKQKLHQYHEVLKSFVESRDFTKAKQIISHIYKIEPLYPLEKEEILIMIYKYKLEEVKEVIRIISNPELKSELEKLFKYHIKRLYEETRQAARKRDYDYFKAIPKVWKHKDEYSMTPLHYFALGGDLEGVLMALNHTDLTFMEANIFGHNFIDLICLGNAPEILENIRDKVDLKQMEDRARFFETGQEGYFFSSHMSREDRLLELNKRLMSPDYFDKIRREMENKESIDVDHVIRQIFAGELEAIDNYPEKDEFEKSTNYKKRCQEFKQQYLDRIDFIEEYKRQNKSMVERIEKRLGAKKSCFISALLAWIDYKDKDLEALKSLKTRDGMLKLLNLYFPIKAPRVEIGAYNADKEFFFMIVDDEVREMKVPLIHAENFRDSFDPLRFVWQRVIKDEIISKQCLYEFEGEKFKMVLDSNH